jgi:hypothetical protein
MRIFDNFATGTYDLPPGLVHLKGEPGAFWAGAQAASQAAGVCCPSARWGRSVWSSIRHPSTVCLTSSSVANQC